jgi:hypothetical protein
VAAHRLTMRVATERQAWDGTLARIGTGVAALLAVRVGVGLAQDPLAVGDQGLAIVDGLGEAVAEGVQGRIAQLPSRSSVSVSAASWSPRLGSKMLVQGHDLLDSVAGSGPVLPRLRHGLGHRWWCSTTPPTWTS